MADEQADHEWTVRAWDDPDPKIVALSVELVERGLPEWATENLFATYAVCDGTAEADLPWIQMSDEARPTERDLEGIAMSGAGLHLFLENDVDLRNYAAYFRAGGRGLTLTRWAGQIRGDSEALSFARSLEILVGENGAGSEAIPAGALPALRRLVVDGGTWASLSGSSGLRSITLRAVPASAVPQLPASLHQLSLELDTPFEALGQFGLFPELQGIAVIRQRRVDLSPLAACPALTGIWVERAREVVGTGVLRELRNLKDVELVDVRAVDDWDAVMTTPGFRVVIYPNYLVSPEGRDRIPEGKIVAAERFRPPTAPTLDGQLVAEDFVLDQLDEGAVLILDGADALQRRLDRFAGGQEATNSVLCDLVAAILEKELTRPGLHMDAGEEIALYCSGRRRATELRRRIIEAWNDDARFPELLSEVGAGG